MGRDLEGAFVALAGVAVGEPTDMMPGHHRGGFTVGTLNEWSCQPGGPERVENFNVFKLSMGRERSFKPMPRRC